jgi:hypothetical protein
LKCFASHFILITAAALLWAESFGCQPDSDDEECIDVEQAVNSAIARGKRFRCNVFVAERPHAFDLRRQRE